MVFSVSLKKEDSNYMQEKYEIEHTLSNILDEKYLKKSLGNFK